MAVPGKIFKLAEFLSMEDVAHRLKDYRIEQPYDEGELHCSLISEIVSLVTKGNTLQGVFSYDYVIQVLHRDKIIPTPQTVSAIFNFFYEKQTAFLIIVQKKSISNFIANKLSTILYGKIGGVLEAKISPETIKQFQRDNPEDTKITFFDNVDIPNMDKISLYGDLSNTSLFADYSKHGDIWYVVARTKEYGYLVGLTREASVTIFNLTDKEKYLKFVSAQICPLTE